MPRRRKQAVMLLGDFIGLTSCVFIAVWITTAANVDLSGMLAAALITIAVQIALAAAVGYYQSIVRYLGIGLVWVSLKIIAISSLTLFGAVYVLTDITDPLRVAIAFGALALNYLVASRYVAQYALIQRQLRRERVILFGAGEASTLTAHALQKGGEFRPVALIDDDESLHGKFVNGLKVYDRSAIDDLVSRFGVTKVLLAMPGISRRDRQDIINWLEPKSIHVQTIPSLEDLLLGRAKVDDIGDVDVADLLDRPVIPPDPELMNSTVRGKSVMVTGAGGSIGAELCRQIIKLEPRTIVLFELSEAALYDIDKDLRQLAERAGATTEIYAILGSVQNFGRLREVLQSFDVDTVYHAAAYKHVPIVEQNLLEGVSNNVFGTLCAVRAANASKVDTFVLISTDKAVFPTNAMGATKRVAELILQAMQSSNKHTRFCIVRFGNVLASSGSVVPLFREQIANGGPVTVTHPDVTRYFMTIPEAAQLVIQAASMAQGGDVFVLDMGEPIRISNLARRMIRLMGLTVRESNQNDGDIKIQYTGLRPGEKLHEELLIGSKVIGTPHPQIMRAAEEFLPLGELSDILTELENAVLAGDRKRAWTVLKQCVSGYAPRDGIRDLVWVNGQSGVASHEWVDDELIPEDTPPAAN